MSDHSFQEASTEPAADYQPHTVTIEVDPVKLELLNARNSGVSWINTVALFAIINSALTFMEVNLRFIFGLGVADIAAFMAQASESSGAKVVAIGITLGGTAVFYALGHQARKGATWAFGLAMVLYSLDGMLWVLGRQWLEVVCHALAVYLMFQGMRANMRFKKLYPNG